VLISKLNPKFPRVWAICSPIQNNSICSTEFQVVLPKNPEYFNFIYYFLKSKTVTDELIASASGTSGSHQRVAPEYIFNLSLLFPPQEKIDEFNKIVDAYLEKMTNNHYQIQTLEKLRDTLLPKLMSGQVRVEYEN
jgi:type I restriction enzyme S subunit